jgi:hypothetical protein
MTKNEKTEYDGLKIRPVFPQDKIDWHKAQTLGPDEEQLPTTLYYDHSKWLEEMKTVCKRAGIPLEQHLRKALGLAVEAGRVRDCNYDTGLRLQGPERTGQDILLFFVKKCPHAREGLLRGELTPYPWRISQASGQEQNATPAKKENKSNIVNIQNFKGILGDVQAETVQTGDYASIHKHLVTAEKKKGIFRRIPYWIYILICLFASLITILEWEPIKAFIGFIGKIPWHK